MVDISKQYRTRDGREVRIYAVDGGEDGPVHGAIQARFGWRIAEWHSDGRYLRSSEEARDLIEVKPKITRIYWLAHTVECGGSSYNTAYCFEDADQARRWVKQPHGREVLAITGPHEVTFEEGEGL